MLKYSLITIIIVIFLGYLYDIHLTFLVASLGTLGMTVGLTLQNTLSNFTAGILIKIFQKFKKGEYIQIGKISGTIKNIDIFYTILNTMDGKTAIIPNFNILSGNIINHTRSPIRRNEFSISFSNNVDVEKVTKILRNVLNQENRVLKNQDILIGLSEFSPYSVKFIIRCWNKTEDLNNVYWDLMIKFKKELDKQEIETPFIKQNLILQNKEII
ncbi:mechanosensitive ion channel domain-containing protein [Buchnera aphidicola]|uniref:mechanosensitive ion channel domain-containing protein n=1 Tax=Buchnera aphidicola TaxID=9 RepID=UPI003464B9C4